MANEEVGYQAVHLRLKNAYGPAREHGCVGCDERAVDWAYDGEDPEELSEDGRTRPYSLKLEHYRPMCRACHRQSDLRETCRKGHPRTEENTYRYSKNRTRYCKPCRREYMRAFRAQKESIRNG